MQKKVHKVEIIFPDGSIDDFTNIPIPAELYPDPSLSTTDWMKLKYWKIINERLQFFEIQKSNFTL